MVSLAELSGKLGQFIGNSEVITKAIKDAINSIINSDNEFKSLRKSSSPTPQSSASVPAGLIDTVKLQQKIQRYEAEIASLDSKIKQHKNLKTSVPDDLNKSHESCQSKLQSLQKLKSLNDSLNSLSNNNDDACKNLLKSLCTGLEKFLGFSNGNYTGEGIVYSDLDRLCDGVMSFLHGVLNEVYKNDNLLKYKDPLTTPLAKIKEALYNRERFDSSIRAVSQGIKQWVRGVDGKHNNVTKPLENLERIIDGHLTLDMEKMSLVNKLQNWQSISGLYLQDAEKAERALEVIDGNLRSKIADKIELVKTVVSNFWTSANDRAVTTFVTQLENRFSQHRREVRTHISSQINEVDRILNVKFSSIEKNINEVRLQKTTQIKKIESAVSTAEKLAEDLLSDDKSEGFTQKYKNDITQRFDEIKTEIEKFAKNDDNSTELLKQFGIVNQQVTGLEVDVLADLDRLKEGINELAAGVQNDKAGGNGLVSGELTDLQTAMTNLGSKTLEPITSKSAELWVNYEQESKGKIEGLASHLSSFREAIYGQGGSHDQPAADSLAKCIIDLTAAIGGNGDDADDDDDDDADEDGKLDKAIKKFNDAAEAEIRNAARTAIERALEEFKMKRSDTGEDQINVKAIMGLFEKSRSALTIAVQKIHEELGALKNVPSTVQQNQQTAGYVMDDLKSRIDGILDSIKAINEPIRLAGEALESAIKAVEAALQTARQTANGKLQELKINLQGFVNRALNDLEDSVENMFDSQKKAELKALYTSVSAQVPQIADIIQKDSDTGLKGLMNKLQDTFEIHELYPSGNELRLFAVNVQNFWKEFFGALKEQSDLLSYEERITSVTSSLDSLLDTMFDKKHFHHSVSEKIDALQKALHNFTPTKFAEASPLLNVIKQGVTDLHEELRKQYVSRYSGVHFTGPLVKPKENSKTIPVKVPKQTDDNNELTDEGRNAAKVCATLLAILRRDLNNLREECDTNWKTKKICEVDGDKKNPLGVFLQRCGFQVAKNLLSKEGELKLPINDFTGDNIQLKLNDTISTATQNEHLKTCLLRGDDFNALDILDCLFDHLTQYNKTCHLIIPQSPKSPSSVNEMLQWLVGLRYNPMRQPVVSAFNGLFSDAEKGLAVTAPHDVLSKLSKSTLRPNTLAGTLTVVCRQAEKTLIAIQGYGHSDGRYACEFSDNSRNLMYPTNPAACMDMLIDILCRLQQQLCFLYRQCCVVSKCSGWRDCHYGQHVAGSSWQCNEKQCPDQTCDQTCNQKCKQHPDCGLKSPLQSFLEDGLQGFLPHQFKTPGCKLECTVSNHRGLPCKTPMGFGELATTASHTKTGAYLRDVLYDFCGDASKPLSRLCGYLVCLVNRPPGTLGEMFGFYYSFIHGWSGSGTHRKDGFNKAVISANFENESTSLDIAPIFKSIDHKSGNCMPHLTGDLHALVKCTGTTGDAASHPCGPYMRSLCHDIRGIYSETYAAKYLSWIVYLTETFYKLLSNLYDECNSKCGGEKPRCRKSKCITNCGATKWPMSPESTHDESCHSIVNCTFTLPTLCKYGLYFENTLDLAGMNGMPLKRTCNDFCTLLKTVLNENSVLVKLFHAIDGFLKQIRWPFMTTLLALWSLSLLYLLHIAVVRLDVLRIRSHLRSPASHRIAAQSLLAAARVRALANVKYFSAVIVAFTL
ncbi:hypothetical protein, conserved [Babesia ovata]|uniref:C3H1-type domain-containing protein n=1 Tax=Babesia ovata TaxID=189622 RepID=A0A2H6KJL4_9APIC|nr:uncharacterized protein BOVATA_046860 [Babesia ovata]GBE63193.1 hypothetical protein, conserved [Babesia ovata]